VQDHTALIRRYIQDRFLAPGTRHIFENIPAYLAACPGALLISARMADGRLGRIHDWRLLFPDHSLSTCSLSETRRLPLPARRTCCSTPLSRKANNVASTGSTWAWASVPPSIISSKNGEQLLFTLSGNELGTQTRVLAAKGDSMVANKITAFTASGLCAIAVLRMEPKANFILQLWGHNT
jgi:hypothetical protein